MKQFPGGKMIGGKMIRGKMIGGKMNPGGKMIRDMGK